MISILWWTVCIDCGAEVEEEMKKKLKEQMRPREQEQFEEDDDEGVYGGYAAVGRGCWVCCLGD